MSTEILEGGNSHSTSREGQGMVHHLRSSLIAAEGYLQSGDVDQASDLIVAARTSAPSCPIVQLMAARIHHLKGELSLAQDSYERTIALDPTIAIAYSNLAIILLENERYAEALAKSLKAIELDAEIAPALLTAGRALYAMHRADLAEPYLERALIVSPDCVNSLNVLGRILSQLGRSEEAIGLHRRAVSIDPTAATSWHGLGVAQRSLGRFADAIESLSQALELWPELGEAQADLALCRRTDEENVLLNSLLEKFSSPELPIVQRASTGFAIGKQLDDLGRYNEAFYYYREANYIFRSNAAKHGKAFSIAEFAFKIDKLISIFDTNFFSEYAHIGMQSDMPLFVLGHYRAGTTLTEQILASHPSVRGAGELPHLLRLNRNVMRHWAKYHQVNGKALNREARRHLARLKGFAGQSTYVVDKHPDNVLALGLIATMFPKARVVICHRDIRDNVLSCFFQRFSEEMTFSNDLKDCAERYLQVERLIAHWRSVIPMQLVDLQYESLVVNFEEEVRRLLDHLGLPWSSACAQFYETDRSVNTPSAWGVRQPIYRTAVHRWKNYSEHLEPVMKAIEAFETDHKIEWDAWAH